MPRLLKRLDVREISLVGRPANRRQFLVVKMNTEEEKQMDKQVQEKLQALDEVIGRVETYALEEAEVEEMVADLREAYNGLGEALGEAEKAGRKPEDEEYGDGRPKRKLATKTEAEIERRANTLVQKSDGKISRAEAWAKVVKANPDLYADYRREREREAAARR